MILSAKKKQTDISVGKHLDFKMAKNIHYTEPLFSESWKFTSRASTKLQATVLYAASLG